MSTVPQSALPRRHTVRNAVLIGLGVVVVLLGIGFLAGLFGPAPTPSPETVRTLVTTGTWREVQRVEGTDRQDSAPFTVVSYGLRITWSFTPSGAPPCESESVDADLTIYPYRNGERMGVIASGNQTTGTSYDFEGPGTWSLSIVPTCANYLITVEELY